MNLKDNFWEKKIFIQDFLMIIIVSRYIIVLSSIIKIMNNYSFKKKKCFLFEQSQEKFNPLIKIMNKMHFSIFYLIKTQPLLPSIEFQMVNHLH